MLKMENRILVKNTFYFNRHVLIEITKKCNLYCLHCFTDAGERLKDELTGVQWEKVAADLIGNGFDAFTLSGGEPLLELKKTLFLTKSIRALKKRAKIYLFTGGLLVNKNIVNAIKKHFNGVVLSLDGNEKTHDWLRGKQGSYKAAIRAIRILNKVNIPVSLQTMVTPQTQPHLEEVVQFAKQNRVKAIRFSHVDFFGRAKGKEKEIGCSQDRLALLQRQARVLRKRYNIFITTNLILRGALLNNPSRFRTPSLHVLPDGVVLPWYGFPKKYLLWKYPEETLTAITEELLDKRLKKFYTLLRRVEKKVTNSKARQLIDYDNVIASCLLEDEERR